MKIFLICIFSIISSIPAIAQVTPQGYIINVKKAENSYTQKEFLQSGFSYSLAFTFLEGKAYNDDRYNAACSYSLANEKDSSFYHLNRLLKTGNFLNYNYISKDSNLFNLHSDYRWNELLKNVRHKEDSLLSGFDRQLINKLDSLRDLDQKWREMWRVYKNNQIDTSLISLDSISKKMREVDSLNYYELKLIIDKYGFPNYRMVGKAASQNYWLLVQHQDKQVDFQKEVLILLKKEVDSNNASSRNYAYLLDRTKVNSNEKQVYGTQMKINDAKTSYEPKEVIEPEKLNERRKSIGLEPIEDYIILMNERYSGTLKIEKEPQN